MKSEGSGNVTGLKFENRILVLNLVLVVQSKAPYLQGARLLAGDLATNFNFFNARFHWFVRYQMRLLIGW